MSIDKINGIDKIVNKKEIKPISKSNKTDKTDSVQISDKAKELALREKYIKMIKDSPEIDNSKKIEELKNKVNEPDFLTQRFIEEIAKKIAESLGLL